jgi:hypothetical protein
MLQTSIRASSYRKKPQSASSFGRPSWVAVATISWRNRHLVYAAGGRLACQVVALCERLEQSRGASLRVTSRDVSTLLDMTQPFTSYAYFWARNSRMACLSSSSSIRLNNFVPSVLIVSGRSNGKRWYIFPPAKWQGWQCACRIGWIWVAKSTFEDVDADGNGIPTWRELAADGASVRCVRSQAQKAKASARIKMLFSTDTNLPKTDFFSKSQLRR